MPANKENDKPLTKERGDFMRNIVATIPDFKVGDIQCGGCGREIHLWYNGGELDSAICCGFKYQTKHIRADLVISRIQGNKANV